MARNAETPVLSMGVVNEDTRKLFEALYDLKRTIDGVVAEKVDPLKREMKEKKQRFKEDTGVDLTDINNFFKIYCRERSAAEMDEEDPARIKDNMRILFRALRSEQMLDLFNVLEFTDADADIESVAFGGDGNAVPENASIQ